MVSYRQLQRDPISSSLFNNQITTLEGLLDLQNNETAYIALDTEHFSVTSEDDRILDQVGLAYLTPIVSPLPRKPNLEDFYTHNQAQALTLHIIMSENERYNILRARGSIPARRPCRFGLEKHVQLEDLEATMINFVETCSSSSTRTNTKKLILIGFGMAAEWEYLFQYFPRIISYLSAWIDLRSIGQDIAPVGVLPGLTALLKLFGYFWKDLKPGRPVNGIHDGIADNAGDDVIATLALAQAYLYPELQEKLKFHQACSNISRNCSRKKAHHTPQLTQFPFIVTVKSDGLLPRSINSGFTLASHFFHFTPSSTGTLSADTGYLTFQSQIELDRFIQHVDGLVLSGGEKLAARQLESDRDGNPKPDEANEQKKKQELRRRSRLERDGEDEIDDLGTNFGNLMPF